MEISVRQPQEILITAPDRIQDLVDSFIQAQDVKPSSKAIYRDWETDRKSTRLNSSHRL